MQYYRLIVSYFTLYAEKIFIKFYLINIYSSTN